MQSCKCFADWLVVECASIFFHRKPKWARLLSRHWKGLVGKINENWRRKKKHPLLSSLCCGRETPSSMPARSGNANSCQHFVNLLFQIFNHHLPSLSVLTNAMYAVIVSVSESTLNLWPCWHLTLSSKAISSSRRALQIPFDPSSCLIHSNLQDRTKQWRRGKYSTPQ